MANDTVKTPKNSKPKAKAPDSSGKKLVQARLPFKIISTTLGSTEKEAEKTAEAAKGSGAHDASTGQDARKRKLSYDEGDSEKEIKSADSKENLVAASKKKKTTDAEVVEILISDDEDDKTVKNDAAEKKITEEKAVEKSTPNTPDIGGKRKGAGTPQSAGKAPSFQIKLPLPGSKKQKRRKTSLRSQESEAVGKGSSEARADSSDDAELGNEKLNPQKRVKVDTKNITPNKAVTDKTKPETPKREVKEDTKQEITEKEVEKHTKRVSPRQLVKEVMKQKTPKSAVKVLMKQETSKEYVKNQKKNEASKKNETPKRKNETPTKKIETPKQKNEAPTKEGNAETKSEPHKNEPKLQIWKESSKNKVKQPTEHVDVVSDTELEITSDAESKSTIQGKHTEVDTEDTNEGSIVGLQNTPSGDPKEAKSQVKEPLIESTKGKEPKVQEDDARSIEARKLENNVESTKKQTQTEKEEKATTKNNQDKLSSVKCDEKPDTQEETDKSNDNHNVHLITDSEGRDEADNSDEQSCKNDTNNSVKATTPITNLEKKNYTPKQLKLMEQRRKAREEKERKLQEEKLQKQREKEAKELEKKREREDKEKQRRKEREEKEEAKRKEREDKEQKRLAELEAKNEEKRKRNEAKEEEIRKKEEERKRKEQEKEEAEMKKEKERLRFTKFFAKPSVQNMANIEQEQISSDASEVLAFRPFQIKGDMKLAPICRKVLSESKRAGLDEILGNTQVQLPKSELYIAQLKAGKLEPYKWKKPLQDPKDDDVIICEDELDRAGQAIVEETHDPIERHRVKFYKFDENRRPPYYGTWRKKTNIVTARKPFAQDKKFFDYEVDSDLEWEDEEPGESLDGSDDDKEKESEDEDYEMNEWFVPHGHLSEEELQNEDDFGVGDENDREAQKAKLKLLQQEFAQEMKKKTVKIKPRLIGCIWMDENGNQPELCPKIIWDTLNQRAMMWSEPPIVEEPEEPPKSESTSPNEKGTDKITEKLKPIVLSESMLKELVRLVHGNRNSKNFLIKEFIAYVEANEDSIKNGDVRVPLKSAVREKIDEFAKWQVTELESSNKKKNTKKQLCWIVAHDVLKRMDLESLSLCNKWSYTLQPKVLHREAEAKGNEPEKAETEKAATPAVDRKIKKSEKSPTTPKTPRSEAEKAKPTGEIMKFTKKLTAEEKAKQLSAPPAQKSIKDTVKTDEAPKKKRVALLMSVPRGEQINTSTKNMLISNFLKKDVADRDNTADDDVVVLE